MAAGGGAVLDTETRRRAHGKASQLRADTTEIAALTAGFQATGYDLIARAAIGGFTGYGPGRGASDVGRSSTRSDPTAAGAEALEHLREHPERADPVAHHTAAFLDHLHQGLEQLRLAEAARQAATRVPARELEPGERRAPGCVNCERFEIWAIVEKAGRCGPCYMYRHRNDLRDAPEHVVLARPEVTGKRERIRIDPTQPGSGQ
jgi:hypothetical protein